MCMGGSPNIKTPDPVQESQQPDLVALKNARKKSGQMAGGTLLTGPSGVDTATTPSTGATTLLGG